METKLHISLATLKTLMLKIHATIVKNQKPHLTQDLSFAYHSRTKGKTQIGWDVVIGWKMQKWTKANNVFPNGSLIMYLILTKWLWNPHAKKCKKYIMGMGMHRIVKQMVKNDPKNQAKTIIPEIC